eukprot:SM000076S21751  [mRNA]  locus=s76:61850:63844:- [translate_table: standard]
MAAFRLLREMQTARQRSAAAAVLRAAEDVLPKQRRAAAVGEYAVAALRHQRQRPKRGAAGCDIEGDPGPSVVELPSDVVLHVFRLLDAPALSCATAVCRSWRGLASSEELWQHQYAATFGPLRAANAALAMAGCTEDGRSPGWACQRLLEDHGTVPGGHGDRKPGLVLVGGAEDTSMPMSWRRAFQQGRLKDPSWFRGLKSGRAFCSACKMLVWLGGPSRVLSWGQPLDPSGHCHNLWPVYSEQVVEYAIMVSNGDDLRGFLTHIDSESEEEVDPPGSRFWLVPKFSTT